MHWEKDTLPALVSSRGRARLSQAPGDAVQTTALPGRSPRVHGMVQRRHLVVGQEMIDARKVLPEPLLQQTHAEGVRTHVAASTAGTRTRRGMHSGLQPASARSWGYRILPGHVGPSPPSLSSSVAGLGSHCRPCTVWAPRPLASLSGPCGAPTAPRPTEGSRHAPGRPVPVVATPHLDASS